MPPAHTRRGDRPGKERPVKTAEMIAHYESELDQVESELLAAPDKLAMVMAAGACRGLAGVVILAATDPAITKYVDAMLLSAALRTHITLTKRDGEIEP